MRRRTTTLVRGLAAMIVLLLVVGGVPVGLVREVGWPLPTAVPSWDEVARAITTGSIQDATIIKGLAVIVWLAWTNFTVGLLLEAVALARGRRARRVSGTVTSQRLAANLLTSVSLALTMLGRPAAVAASEPAQLRLAVATALAETPASPSPQEAQPPRPSSDAYEPSRAGTGAGAARTHLVERGDNLWDLAERFLGDGLRWREIREANIGRPQPDGGALDRDSHDIRPGWTLVIPERGPIGQQHDGSPDDAVTVERGDTLWGLAEDHLDDPRLWGELFEENEGRPQPDGRTLTDPDLIHPGWVLDLPGVDEPDAPISLDVEADQRHGSAATDVDVPVEPSELVPTETGPAPSGVSRGPVAPTDAISAPEHDQEADESSVEQSDQHPYVLVTSAAALAAGVVLTLDRLRRARMRRREPGTRIPLPEGTAAENEQLLRNAADEETATFIDLALRELARTAEDGRFPLVTLVTYGPDDLAVHLASSQPEAPSGWEARGEGCFWTRRRPADLSDLDDARGTPSFLPALVTIGADDDGRTALLNLGRADCLHLDGDEEAISELLRAWALELATTSRADAIDVVTYGVEDLPADLERLEAIEDGDELRERLSAPPTNGAHRPSMVLLVADVERDLVSWIRVATEQRRDLAAVVGTPPPRPGAWAIQLDGEEARLQPDGLSFTPLGLDDTGLEAASVLLDQAKHEEDRPVPIPPLPEGDEWLPSRPERQQTPDVLVRILGKVEVDGAGPFTTNKTMELVVYLAMHRDGADTDTLMEALWPEQPPRPARLYTEASRARKALGTVPDGTPYLPDADKGIYRLSDAVALDYEQFQKHVDQARRHPDEADRHLHAALDLIDGRPLSKTATEYAWAINDSYRITQEIVDVAHDLAQRLMGEGHHEEATEAAEVGLKADPIAEVLYRDLMEAAAATGNAARVHTLMTRLRRQIAENGDANDADDYLHPNTIALYDSLTESGTHSA